MATLILSADVQADLSICCMYMPLKLLPRLTTSIFLKKYMYFLFYCIPVVICMNLCCQENYWTILKIVVIHFFHFFAQKHIEIPELKIVLSHVHKCIILKVGSCPNNDNSVLILFCPFYVVFE